MASAQPPKPVVRPEPIQAPVKVAKPSQPTKQVFTDYASI